MLEKELSNFKKYFAKHRRRMTMLESGVLDEFIQYLSSRRTKRAPDEGQLVLRACVNGECGWVGKESACLTWKHAGDERMCPHCNDNTESVSLSALRG